MSTLYITHSDCVLHEMGEWHPESPARLTAVENALRDAGLWDQMIHRQAPKVKPEHLARVHGEDYLQHLATHAPHHGHYALDADTAMNPHTLNAANRAAGAGILAVEEVMSGRAKRAFCAVRPPGHHATPHAAMGFCFYNNIAVAAAYAVDVLGVERVAVIDFDVHHGNGTEDMLADNPAMLMCSFYQHPFYPGRHHEPPAANMINIPVPAGTDGITLRDIVATSWLPALQKFQPQLLLVSAGFDAHRQETLAQLNMEEADYAWITEQLLHVANASAQGRLVSMLEGGYHLTALGNSVVAHIKPLITL